MYTLDAEDQARFGIAEPDDDDWQAELEPCGYNTCSHCGEPIVVASDHAPECEDYEEFEMLPF